jgi:hypothetical protein
MRFHEERLIKPSSRSMVMGDERQPSALIAEIL